MIVGGRCSGMAPFMVARVMTCIVRIKHNLLDDSVSTLCNTLRCVLIIVDYNRHGVKLYTYWPKNDAQSSWGKSHGNGKEKAKASSMTGVKLQLVQLHYLGKDVSGFGGAEPEGSPTQRLKI
jgi:hypothetical protein